MFEYLEHDLAGLITLKDRSLPVSQIKFFMRQMLEALSHCHSQGIMHRDVKVRNITTPPPAAAAVSSVCHPLSPPPRPGATAFAPPPPRSACGHEGLHPPRSCEGVLWAGRRAVFESAAGR